MPNFYYVYILTDIATGTQIRQDSLPDFFTAGQAVRDQRRIDKTETGKAREGCPAVALAEADQPIRG